MTLLKAVRGTRDLLPPETELWERVEATTRRVFARYNFGEIRTPIFEDTQLFARGVGEETDIVSKEMYTWEDRARAQSEKSQSLTLRPENTAGVVRAYIEHKMGETGLLQKLYYIGPQFRRERPQKGRYRQFWQIGAEVIGPPSAGSESPLRDAEVLEMLASFLDELGISGWTLVLNSVGSSTDRPRYVAALREALAPVKHQMSEDNQRRAETNPLRVLDSKDPSDEAIVANLPKIADYLDEASKAHFAAVLAALDACGVQYEVNPRLVRGLDYYTRTTFEFTHGGLGAQNALLGGGPVSYTHLDVYKRQTQLRPGMIIKHNNELHSVFSVEHRTPGNLRAFIQAKLRNLRTGAMFEHRFRSPDPIERVVVDEIPMDFLYNCLLYTSRCV